MQKAWNSESDDPESLPLQRRKFIRGRFSQVGKVTESDMRDWLSKRNHPWSLKAMRADIEFIERYEDKRVFELIPERTGEHEWIDDSRKLGLTRYDRLSHNRKGKMAIGKTLAALVLGFGKAKFTHIESKEEILIDCLTNVLSSVNSAIVRSSHQDSSVIDKLECVWKSGERRLFLDAGTTTQLFSEEFVEHFRLPMHGIDGFSDISKSSDEQCLNRLEVVTNDRHIFFRLGEASVHTRAIVVGGHQQYRSGAVSGAMAEQFLDSTGIKAHVAIVGATSICLNTGTGEDAYAGAENEHIANIKLRFLKKADVRIMVSDSSKFFKSGGHTDFRVCPLTPDYVDLIVTDHAEPSIEGLFSQLPVPVLVVDRL